ncbi:MAG: GTPase ObgE [Planctomycetota bacterium]
MFKDHAVIYVSAGKGGNGAISFRREKYVPAGGPDGGNGGHGGSVYLVADGQESTLISQVRNPHVRAENGVHGQGRDCHGRRGEDSVIKVPIGTLVFDKNDETMLRDLKNEGDRVCVAKGGRGGFGNEHFKSSSNQTPRQANPGSSGESRTLRLELKLIADVGLVGLPNAGKSTFISKVSAAHPKVADYPFTTLDPHPGIVEMSGFRRFVMMDIPGLIEGAAVGQGLGHRFLKHVERTRALVHLVDMAPMDESDPVEAFRTIVAELERYSPALAKKPRLTVFSKADLVADPVARAAELAAEMGVEAYAVSSATGFNVERLLEDIWVMIKPESE